MPTSEAKIPQGPLKFNCGYPLYYFVLWSPEIEYGTRIEND